MKMTASELLAWGDESYGYELVEGVLVQMSPTGGAHGNLALDLGAALRAFVKPRGLGRVLAAETGFLLSQVSQPDTVLAADAAFVRADRAPVPGSPEWDGYWRLAPDLVVEVVSPGQSKPALAAKARTWLEAGTRLVWIVWPVRQQVDVWRAGSRQLTQTLHLGTSLDGLDVLPGFTYPLDELFA
jgi:Uma2 family endonuclease